MAYNFGAHNWGIYDNKKLSCRTETARCFVFVCIGSFNIPTARFFITSYCGFRFTIVHKSLLWLGYPMVKKFRRYLYSFWRNSRTWQTHRQTDRRTDTAWQHRPRLCIASRSKNDVPVLYRENWPKSTAVITGVIFTCPGRAGPVFSLDRRRPRLFRNYSAPRYTAIYSLTITIYGSPSSRHFVKTNHVHCVGDNFA